jgi:phosphinothricin acetyltransferase
MLDIYTPIIQNTATSFEFELPTNQQFLLRVSNIQNHFPWLVCTKDSGLTGYAYAGPHRGRKAYQWSAELSVYIDPKFHRLGIARALYTALIEILKLQGYFTVLAGISLPNENSVSFHESLGFTPIGVYHNIGYKFNRWHSVGWWQYAVSDYPTHAPAPQKAPTIINSPAGKEILHRAVEMIKTNN